MIKQFPFCCTITQHLRHLTNELLILYLRKTVTVYFIPCVIYSLFFVANKWLVVVVVYINDQLEHGKDYPFVATQRHVVWMLKQGNLKLDLADLVFELFEVQRKYTNIVLTVQKPGRKTQGTQRHLPSQLTRNQNITMITKCTLQNSTSKWN